MFESFINIRRTPYQSLSMILIQIFVSFLIVLVCSGTLFILALLNTVESEPKVVVYFHSETEEAKIFKIREEVLSTGDAADIVYISKTQAYDIYRKQVEGTQSLIEDIPADIFPPSLEIKAKNAALLESIATKLQKKPEVEEVHYQQKTIQKLLSVTNAVRYSIIAFVGYLALMTVVTLSTMTNFKIALRKEEIEIYELLGATSGFITKPFYLESYIITTLATSLGSGLFVSMLWYVRPALTQYLQGISKLAYTVYGQTFTVWPYDVMTLGTICTATLILMLVISTVSTSLATRKYL